MVRSGDGELARIAVGTGSERVGSGQEQIRRAGRHSEPLQLAGGRAGEAVSDEEHLVQERREGLEILDFAKVDGAWRGATRRGVGVDEDANEGAGRALVAADSVRPQIANPPRICSGVRPAKLNRNVPGSSRETAKYRPGM